VRAPTARRRAPIWERGEPVAELVVRVDWGGVEGAIRLIVPTSFLAQYDSVLSRTATTRGLLKAEAGSGDMMRANLAPVVVNMSAILGQTEMTLERLLSLAVGDVVRLDSDPSEPLTICIEGVPKVSGYPTVQHGNVAVRIFDFHGDESSGQGAGDARDKPE